MSTKLFFLGLLLGLISCDKEKTEIKDYREEITGDYFGIRVDTYWIDTIVGYGHDTSEVSITLTSSDQEDSIVNIAFNPSYSNEDFSFKYNDGKLISTSGYHPPTLSLENDSLYFKHQAGLGPIWTECFAEKLKFD